MAHHNGMKKKTRYKYSKGIREHGLAPVTRVIQEFEIGQKVHIVIDPSVQTGMPFRRFHGRTGIISGKQGRAWLLTITDGGLTKEVIALPQHLRAQTL